MLGWLFHQVNRIIDQIHSKILHVNINDIGLAYRRCSQDSVWDDMVNITQCQSIELPVINTIIRDQYDILTNTFISNFSSVFDITEVQQASEELSLLTTTSFAMVPNDVITTNEIIKSIVRLVMHCNNYSCSA